jgi:hypothetical protein
MFAARVLPSRGWVMAPREKELDDVRLLLLSLLLLLFAVKC